MWNNIGKFYSKQDAENVLNLIKKFPQYSIGDSRDFNVKFKIEESDGYVYSQYPETAEDVFDELNSKLKNKLVRIK
jgi:hypothetical protein